MARFPDSPAPQGGSQKPYPFAIDRPTVGGGPRWALRTMALTRGELFSADLSYVALTWTKVQTLLAFWNSVGGPNGTFSFADFNGFEYGASPSPGVDWTDLYVGKGTGVQKVWTLPTFELKQFAAIEDQMVPPTVKVGGATLSDITWMPDDSGTDGYITSGGGTDGFDKITFDSAPAAAALITISGRCRRGVRVARFASEKFPFNVVNPFNYQGGVLSIVEQVG